MTIKKGLMKSRIVKVSRNVMADNVKAYLSMKKANDDDDNKDNDEDEKESKDNKDGKERKDENKNSIELKMKQGVGMNATDSETMRVINELIQADRAEQKRRKKEQKKARQRKKEEETEKQPEREPMVFCYMRVSTENQHITSQDVGLVEYMRRNHITNYIQVSESVSGAKEASSRKLGMLLSQVKRGDKIIVSEISRIGRSMFVIVGVMMILVQLGVELISVKEDFHLDNSPMSKLILQIYSYAAETERTLIICRTKEGLERARRNGITLGRPKGGRQHWYRIDKIDNGKIIKWLNKGMAKSAIAKKLGINRSTVYYYIKNKLTINELGKYERVDEGVEKPDFSKPDENNVIQYVTVMPND